MSDAASAPLTPEQIREMIADGLRELRHIPTPVWDSDEALARLDPPRRVPCQCRHCRNINDAIALLDSQALALTQAQQEVATLKEWRDGFMAKARELSQAVDALTAERDALKEQLGRANMAIGNRGSYPLGYKDDGF